MTKAVAKAKENMVAEYDDFDFLPEEEVGSHELSIPFYNVLQANSPEVEEQSVLGAKAGMIMNTVTKELHTTLNAVMVKKDYQYVEWIPRDMGGGFVGVHAATSEVTKDAIKANGGTSFGNLKVGDNDLVETFFAYIMQYDPDTAMPAGFGVISFSKTKIKPYKDWITSMRLIVPPVKFRVTIGALIGTFKDKNSKGQSYYNIKISPAGSSWKDSLLERPKMDGVLREAGAFQKMIASGMAKADFKSTTVDSEDGDVPF